MLPQGASGVQSEDSAHVAGWVDELDEERVLTHDRLVRPGHGMAEARQLPAVDPRGQGLTGW